MLHRFISSFLVNSVGVIIALADLAARLDKYLRYLLSKKFLQLDSLGYFTKEMSYMVIIDFLNEKNGSKR